MDGEKKYVLFVDIDDTLVMFEKVYNMQERCIKFYMDMYGLNAEEAEKKVNKHRTKHGHSAIGIKKKHPNIILSYLECVYPKEEDGYYQSIGREERICAVLETLKERWGIQIFFFTNSPKIHAVKVLTSLGISIEKYDGIICPEFDSDDTKVKPMVNAYEHAMTIAGVSKSTHVAILADDDINNITSWIEYGHKGILIKTFKEDQMIKHESPELVSCTIYDVIHALVLLGVKPPTDNP